MCFRVYTHLDWLRLKLLVSVSLQGYQAMSPHNNNDLMASSLPPMSTFRGPGQPGYHQSSSPTVNGSGQQQQGPPGGTGPQPGPPPPGEPSSTAPPPPQQTGSGSQSDALGNALKSVSITLLFFSFSMSHFASAVHFLSSGSPPKFAKQQSKKKFFFSKLCFCGFASFLFSPPCLLMVFFFFFFILAFS